MNILIFIPHDTLIGPQGAHKRLEALVETLSDHRLIYFVPESTPAEARRALSGKVVYTFSEPGIASKRIPYLLELGGKWLDTLEGTVRQEEIDLIICSFPWGLSAISKRTSLPIVYFSHGVEADFAEVTLRHLGLSFPVVRSCFQFLIKKMEEQACAASSRVLTISEADSRRLEELYGEPAEKFHHFPQPVLIQQKEREKIRCREILGLEQDEKLILFHGSFSHLPNREAIELIRKRIVPNLRKLVSGWTFLVAGTDVPVFNEPDCKGLGFVSDLDALMGACDVAAVPILSGSGVRMKIFDYFAAGLPTVSTTKGAEGLGCSDGVEILLAADEPDFLAKLRMILTDERLCESLREEAKAFLQRNHHGPSIRVALEKCLAEISANSRRAGDRKLSR